jgi:hypothetical protein
MVHRFTRSLPLVPIIALLASSGGLTLVRILRFSMKQISYPFRPRKRKDFHTTFHGLYGEGGR